MELLDGSPIRSLAAPVASHQRGRSLNDGLCTHGQRDAPVAHEQRELRLLGPVHLAEPSDAHDARGAAFAQSSLGFIAYFRGEYDRADALLGEGLTLARASHDPVNVARALDNLGVEAPDDKTIVFHLKEPFPEFDAVLSQVNATPRRSRSAVTGSGTRATSSSGPIS